MELSLQQMACLNAVVIHGSIHAGAKYLNKTHPTVITSLKKLELQLGFSVFDRSGYRITLTREGKSLYQSVKKILSSVDELKIQAAHLSNAEEPKLNIVIGDITPTPQSLKILRSFSEDNAFTQINLLFENLQGPIEQLNNRKADLIIHYIDKTDPRYEYKNFCQVQIIPVVAPEFLSITIDKNLKFSDLNHYTQCIIRDTSTHDSTKNYFVDEDAPHITVGDQHTKKQVILQNMAWGHMPLFLIEEELQNGSLISIEGEYIKKYLVDIVVTRLNVKTNGIMLEKLWQYF